jgi:hypothetical protein
MPVAERTYSFRASGDLSGRIREAGALLEALVDESGDRSELPERVARELVLALLRDGSLGKGKRNQSAFLRSTVELVLRATEKVSSDLHWADAYAKERAGSEFRDSAKTRIAERWQDA